MLKKKLGVIALTVLLVGCGSEGKDLETTEEQPSMELITVAMENGDYATARSVLQELIKEQPDNEEAKNLSYTLLAFKEVEDAIDRESWDEALTKAHQLLEEKSLSDGIKTKLEELIIQAEVAINDSIKEMVDQNTPLEELPMADANDATQLDEVPDFENLKEYYLTKLNEVEESLREFNNVLENGTQVELTEAQSQIFVRWDNALNEIYGALASQLSVAEMGKLKNEQREWISFRDKKSKEASLEYEGGTMATLEYISTQTILTRDRCYVLVDRYME